jgi:single-strand DNA-binding protein
MIDNTVTVVGNLTTDPELRFTSTGTAVANFTVASSPRVFDKESSQWRDGDTLFLRCTVWQQAAENLADSLTKGARVIVSGRLRQHSFETQQGDKRTSIELQVDEIGASLRHTPVQITKTTRQHAQDHATTAASGNPEPPF